MGSLHIDLLTWVSLRPFSGELWAPTIVINGVMGSLHIGLRNGYVFAPIRGVMGPYNRYKWSYGVLTYRPFNMGKSSPLFRGVMGPYNRYKWSYGVLTYRPFYMGKSSPLFRGVMGPYNRYKWSYGVFTYRP